MHHANKFLKVYLWHCVLW